MDCWCHCKKRDNSVQEEGLFEGVGWEICCWWFERRETRRDMSAEDLGTRELGQVRSQRLDEVSFCCHSVLVLHHDYCSSIFSIVFSFFRMSRSCTNTLHQKREKTIHILMLCSHQAHKILYSLTSPSLPYP